MLEFSKACAFAIAAFVWVGASTQTLAATDIKLVNPGFEEPAVGARAPGWSPSQHYGPERDFEWLVDATVASEGKASYRIRRLSPQVFGLINQAVAVSAFAGKTLEFSAMLRTDEVGPQGWLLVVNIESRNAILEQVRSAPAIGKHDFQRHSVRFKLPVDAFELKLGAMLLDAGIGWVDEVKLRVLD